MKAQYDDSDYHKKLLFALVQYAKHSIDRIPHLDEDEADQRGETIGQQNDRVNEIERSHLGETSYSQALSSEPNSIKERLESYWSSKPIDSSSTQETREYLAEIVQYSEVAASLESVSCTSTICRSEMKFNDISDAKALFEFAGDPSNDVRWFLNMKNNKINMVIFSSLSDSTLEDII